MKYSLQFVNIKCYYFKMVHFFEINVKLHNIKEAGKDKNPEVLRIES